MANVQESVVHIIPDGTYEAYSHTTYRDTYRPARILPPIKFSQPPSFEVEGVKHVEKREFPLIPPGPHRRLEVDRAPAVGVGSKDINTGKYLDPKPIIKTLPPKNLTNEPLLKKRRSSAKKVRANPPRVGQELFTIGKDIVDAMCKNVSWTSTTQRANNEATRPAIHVEPPRSTFEENSDMVKLRPRRYEDNANLWQSVASVWERTQSRHHTERWRSDDFIPGSKPAKLLHRRPSVASTITVDDHINDLVRNNKLDTSYDRHCPGYAGFVPRSPINTPLEASYKSPITTVMKASYRRLPADEYRVNQFAHQGPLSHLVTLTSPYNPFNKLRKLNE